MRIKPFKRTGVEISVAQKATIYQRSEGSRMGYRESAAAAGTKGTRSAIGVGHAGSDERDFVSGADGLPVGELATRVSKHQQRLLSLSKMVSGWDVASYQPGSATARPTADRTYERAKRSDFG